MDVEIPTAQNRRALKERQREVWASGDFSQVATATVIVSEQLCETVDVRPGERVLDVATGSGNAALAAGRRGSEVHGVDFVPSLLERARERARAERLHIGFQMGDVEAIPFPDDSFDIVLSVFGAMFAPDQPQTANELLRVCRPGGRIGMANWTPDGFVGRIFLTTAQHAPLPPGLDPPFRWGRDETVRQLFGGAVRSLWTHRRSCVFRYRSPRHFLEFYRRYYGPTIAAFDALDEAAQDALAQALIGVVRHFNLATDGTMVVPGDYLEVVAVKA